MPLKRRCRTAAARVAMLARNKAMFSQLKAPCYNSWRQLLQSSVIVSAAADAGIADEDGAL